MASAICLVSDSGAFMNRSFESPDADPFAFLAGGGEMGRLIRSMDWSGTPLGPVHSWPQSLRTTINICLASDLPICVIWGPDLVQLYNDGYRVICGGKHPRSMGQNFSGCWKEAWPVIGEAHDAALAGDTAFLETQHIFLERHGYLEECFFTFSFSPIRDEAGRVGGLFHPVIEMTSKMLGERRTRALRDLAARTSQAKSVNEALELSAQTLADYALDLPFVLLYALDPSGQRARLVGSSGLQADVVSSTISADWAAVEQSVWPLEEVVASGSSVSVNDVSLRIGSGACGPYPELPNAALTLPIIPPGAKRPAAVFIAGVSARLPMNEAYRSFYDLLASGVTTAVANALAYEQERQRAEALAELDRAKTAFFSNISHEFRTPLTLMLGPVEDLLARGVSELPAAAAAVLEVVNRNGLRLLRLVNSLLDFSRIEAGRVRGAYEPTDLAAFTAELASVFRAAVERAGLALTVHCPPLDELVFVDRDMWEKVVLNLLSNAFKFTFNGEIAVSLCTRGSHAELSVRDTGAGVPAAEMPRLFERFHRVENAKARTHEGSGIGLALVQELVKLHGGSISAESIAGAGTTFTVCVPLGSVHLPPEQIRQAGNAAAAGTGAMPFVEEALRWLPDQDDTRIELPNDREALLAPHSLAAQRGADERPRVLVADDNADMRQYVVRLLSDQFRVEAVADGAAALAAVRKRPPDLVLTDVMMPRLDGFGLLRELRADPLTSGLPVIMLSARAGEESRVEGMQAGADDYLVKPFGAKELLARVTAHLKMARMRREAEAAIRAEEGRSRAILESITDGFFTLDQDWRVTYLNAAGERFLDRAPGDLIGKRLWDEFPDTVGSESEQVYRRVVSSRVGESFTAYYPNFDRWYELSAYPAPDGLSVYFRDVSESKLAEARQRISDERFRTLFESMDEGFCIVQMIFDAAERAIDYRILEMNPAFEKHTGLRDVVGKTASEFAPDLDGFWCATYGRVALTGEPIRFVSEAKSLGHRYFDVYAFQFGDADSRKVAILFNNITEQKQAEQERERLVAQLQEQDRRKDEFLATLAHELRNPLAPLRNGLQVMKLRNNSGANEQVHAMMERQLGHMVRLIDDLLDLSRISRDKLELKKEQIELSAVVRNAVEASRPLIEQMGHQLALVVPNDPIYVDGDLTRLSQVLSNLLNNAAKYTERGGRIRLLVERQGHEAMLVVTDNGMGIQEHLLQKVFEMFTQVDQSLERAQGGLGIGLSLVQRLVALHGGSVEAHSEGHGMGSTFVVSLPVAPAVAGYQTLQENAKIAPAHRRRILVADDNRDSAESLAMLLTIMGNETQTAHDGLEALDAAASFRPDLALLDIGMPKLNGYEVCRGIRQQAWGKDMLLVALTGWGQEEDRRQSLAAGFDAHLV